MVSCFFHFIQRLKLYLPELKSKIKPIKNNAKYLLLNIKLLSFKDIPKVDEFFNKIKNKYMNVNNK